MQVLLITQWFDPEPTVKGLTFARELQRRGHTVSVLTGFPNYPGGTIYPGFAMRPWRHESMLGIRVTRVALFPSHSRSVVGRIANYLSFAVTSSIAVLLMRRPDVIYIYHPPATAAMPGLLAKWLKRVPFVVDIQDLWPDTLVATRMLASPLLLRLIHRWMGLVYRQAAHLVVLSPGFRRLLIERGVADRRVSVIANWTFEREPIVPSPSRPADRSQAAFFTIVFAGTMGRAQGLETVLEAARLLLQRLPPVRFLFVGGGIEAGRLRRKAGEMGLANVRFLPRRDAAEMPALFHAADALLVHLRADPLFEVTIPSKTQAYLHAGRPILMGVTGDAARMVRDAGAGLCFESEDPGGLVAAVECLVAMPASDREAMGAAGQKFYEARLSLEKGAARWSELLAKVHGGEVQPDRPLPSTAILREGQSADIGQ